MLYDFVQLSVTLFQTNSAEISNIISVYDICGVYYYLPT